MGRPYIINIPSENKTKKKFFFNICYRELYTAGRYTLVYRINQHHGPRKLYILDVDK